LSSTESFTVTVNNVAPTASVSGPTFGVRGQPRAFSPGASDAGSVDTATGFTYLINWGDGTAPQTIDPTANNGSGLSVDHVFAQTGTYTVGVVATDKDGAASAQVTQSITITATGLQSDSFGGVSGQALVVGGTTGNDNFTFQ